jgi:hypothetical protein
MFVSTTYFSVRVFVARLGWGPLQVQAFTQPGERAAASLVESLAFPYDRFEPVGQKSADRPPFLGRYHTHLAQKIGIELERNVGFHATRLAR